MEMSTSWKWKQGSSRLVQCCVLIASGLALGI